MNLEKLIKKTFPSGLDYDDAAQLCLTLYSRKVLSDELMLQCTKENLPVVFANLSSNGFIRVDNTNMAITYGAHFHDSKDKGHWVEVIASIFKLGNTVDSEKSQSLADRLIPFTLEIR